MNATTQTFVYLNHEYIPLEEAKISVMDRGFLFSDGIYEVIPVYGSAPFLPEDHYKRLQKNLEAIKIDLPFSYTDFMDVIQELIKRNTVQPIQSVYIEITRGVYPQRKQFVEGLTPTVFVKLESAECVSDLEHVLKVITVEDLRWEHCDIKGINRLANILMFQIAYYAHMDEAIIVNHSNVLEGCSSNVFIVEKNTVITPPLSNRLLNGVTRKMVIELVEDFYTLKEETISRKRLLSADEVFLTSSTKEVASVGEIDGTIIGSGKIGSVTRDIQRKYRQHIEHIVQKNLSK